MEGIYYLASGSYYGYLRWTKDGSFGDADKIERHGSNDRWYIKDGTNVSYSAVTDDAVRVPPLTWSNDSVTLVFSKHGLSTSKAGTNITKLVQYDADDTTLTSTEQADNERYFG